MDLHYDIELDIATGTSRTQKTWKNNKMKWSVFIEKLAVTTRTRETLAQYLNMKKPQQDEIKDVGGFVGGYLANGLRSNVKHRQIIALDIDFGNMELWETWSMLYGNASCIYSTHKHRQNNERLRLIIPLDRKVDCDEYQAIARKIASELDIDSFDDTTYQPQRLMYWPSTSSDGDFIFEYIDGDFLCADTILKMYEDWRDITAWPTSSRTTAAMHSSIKKQQDPLEKRGLVGVFCRTYDIHQAIEKFVDDYTPCDIPDRYTYTKGSTSAGIITYDDKFAFSHHGTDPISGQLCNAFDLVRIHRFGNLDEGTDKPNGKQPSFKAMEDWVLDIGEVKKQMFAERAQEMENDFDDLGEAEDTEWETKLKINKQGVCLSNYYNIRLILENDPRFKGKFGFNLNSRREVLLGNTAWRDIDPHDDGIRDNDYGQIFEYFETRYGITGDKKIMSCLMNVCHDYEFNPIQEYIEALEWDGVERLETVFIDYFAVKDNEYVRAVTRKTFLAAITRIYRPGCKFDNMLTIKGPQGCGKSSFFQKLGREWFTDSISDLKHKDTLEKLQGMWIVEMGELSAMRKEAAETIKQFLSGTVDRFRRSYGRRAEDYPRQCIFVATTNEMGFLRDQTGNRRFWIIESQKGVKPAKSVFKLKQEDFDQFWAEAKALYDKGEETIFLDHRLEEMARKVQEAYMSEDPEEAIIIEYLNRKLPEDWEDMDLYDRQQFINSNAEGVIERDRVCAQEIWMEALGYDDLKKLDRYKVAEINKMIDKQPEWVKQENGMRFGRIYKLQRGFRRIKRDS